MKFFKYVSTGNDFVLLEPGAWELSMLPDLARKLCPRRFGVGADGLLVLGPDLILRMFNPDGTEDFCGNGLACAALHAVTQGWADDCFELEHFGRRVTVRRTDQGFEIGLGKADFRPEHVPVSSESEWFDLPLPGWEQLRGSALSTGSAHLVVMVDRLPEDGEFLDWGPALEHHPLFPDRISVIFTQIMEPDRLAIRIWERGVGETLGCGSGSTAAAAVWMRMRGRGGSVAVDNPGGEVVVRAQSWADPMLTVFRPLLAYTGSLWT